MSDPIRKIYQIKLYGWVSELYENMPKYNSETGEKIDTYRIEFDGILSPQALQEVLFTINTLHMEGYTPVGIGTMYPEMVIPNKVNEVLEKWK